MNDQTWPSWFRSNFDKFLLLTAFFGIVSYVIHLVHHNSDSKIIDWAQNLAGQAFAAFLTMVTGSLMRGSNSAPPQNLPPGSTAITQIKTEVPATPIAPVAPVAPTTSASSVAPVTPVESIKLNDKDIEKEKDKDK